MDHESRISSELLVAKNIPLKHQPTHETHSKDTPDLSFTRHATITAQNTKSEQKMASRSLYEILRRKKKGASRNFSIPWNRRVSNPQPRPMSKGLRASADVLIDGRWRCQLL